MPFHLRLARPGVWRAMWTDARIIVAVAGGEDAPHPAHAAALGDLVARWDEAQRTIEGYLRGLLPEGRVPLQSSVPGESFAASSCGFDGTPRYEAITFLEDEPTRAKITFYTGFPDGYATFELTVDGGRVVSIAAFAS